MKKITLITFLTLMIPFLIVTFFIKEDIIEKQEIKLISNQNVRIKRENGEIDIVPFEEYIIGVLAGEMPAKFELEALKAQAVAARSYVLKKIAQNKTEEYDILDTVMNQVYLDEEQMKNKWQDNYEEYFNKLKQAVLETKGEYLTYNGEVIQAFFFSTSTGKTENVEEVFQEALPYLRSVDSSWDSEISPVFSEVNTFKLSEFYQRLNLNYSENLDIDVLETTSTGRIKKIKINGQEFSGTDISQKLNLRSNFFTIIKSGEYVTITTKGYGHGVGMSQYGAQGMAKAGYKYDEILKHYYQGVEISKMDV